MFEDSTFESQGRIHTRSGAWMIATFAFNGSILLALILIPLFYPEALSRMCLPILMEAPPPPPQPPKPIAHVEHVTTVRPEMRGNVLFMPTQTPPHPYIATGPEQPPDLNVAATDFGDGTSANGTNPFGPGTQHTVVRQAVTGPVRVSAPIVEGLLVYKTVPVYPPIAIASRTEGTVVLQATISPSGTIENLRVVSGPIMLQQAALNAVQTWRYRPYLLNGDPVEVETTVKVIFKRQ